MAGYNYAESNLYQKSLLKTYYLRDLTSLRNLEHHSGATWYNKAKRLISMLCLWNMKNLQGRRRTMKFEFMGNSQFLNDCCQGEVEFTGVKKGNLGGKKKADGNHLTWHYAS